MSFNVISEKQYELTKFCNKKNIKIIGGVNKLLSFFIKKHKPHKITTFVDRRYFTGDLCKKNGFSFLHKTEPNYWYVDKNKISREQRFNYRKKIRDDINMPKIYDCGDLKFELNLPQS